MKKVAAWLARLDYIKGEYPFMDHGIYIAYDMDNRIHLDEGFAYRTPTRCIQYNEGRKHGLDVDIFGTMIYYYENIRVNPRWVTRPETVTFDEVMTHPNQECRYVGLKIYGLDRMFDEGRFTILDRDEDKDHYLLQCDILGSNITYVKVLNSTAEPDGTYKPYFLCVPPHIKTCKEGVAWTFGKSVDEYNPVEES
jgi:hypothetical protein